MARLKSATPRIRGRHPGLHRARVMSAHGHLTRHRAMVLALMALGMTQREVADALGNNRTNVHKMVHMSIHAIGAKTLSHAIVLAIDAGYFRYGRIGHLGPDIKNCTLATLRKEMLG